MNETTHLWKRLAALAAEWKLTHLQPQLDACHRLIRLEDHLDVAVFGRFKAGKSSLLNHLAGREVLPVGVVPVTATITRLRHGPEERATVLFLNGQTRSVSVAEVGLYISETANPGNAKQVAAVEVELPTLAPLAPLEFVDTPGLGSALAHNTAAAMQWLPHVGAALVAISSDAPLAGPDLDLVEQLRPHTPSIALLLTKADLLTEGQRAEVRAFVQQQMRLRWGREWPVFFYSTKADHSHLRQILVEQLLRPLQQARGIAGQQILEHKLAALASQTLDHLRVALAAATQTEAARQALRARLDDERQHWELLREELQGLVHAWAAHALEDSLRRLEPLRATLQTKVAAALQEQYPQWRLRLPQFVAAWRAWLQTFLVRELEEVSRAQAAMFAEPLHKARKHLHRVLQAFHDRLAGHVQAALGVTLAPREFVLELREPSAPPVDVGFGFDVALDLAGYLIPMTLFRRLVERRLTRKARWEVEKNLSRLAAAWSDGVTAALGELTRQAEHLALSELGALERSAGQTQGTMKAVQTALQEAEQIQRVLLAKQAARERSVDTTDICEAQA